MKVKCTICDEIEDIDESSFQAKRLRNRRVNLYLCKVCHDRISVKTKARHATGKFRLFTEQKDNDLI